MLTIQNLSIQYGDKHLFKDISAKIHPQDRIGLVGVNGAGKSTLMKIMVGRKMADEKVVIRARRATVGYLPQEVENFPAGRNLYQEAESAFAEALRLQAELDEVNRQLAGIKADSPECAALMERQGDLQHELEGHDVFRIQSQVEKVLTGLGFKPADFSKECRAFSGGWLMRLMLAKLLLARPSLLLLDEPTNHLDLDSLTWLEDFLKSYQGALVIISHDRAFLDNVTTLTWELSLGRLNTYKGNYSLYLRQKEERLTIQRAAWENQQANIQQTMRFVERFRAKSTKASQVQSRLRQLEKMDKVELEESEARVDFRFPPAPASGRLAVEVRGLSKRFGQLQVFDGLSFTLERGEKMAVVGVNGAGKSTLVKTLAGLIAPDGGNIRFGHNVKLSYFGQHQAQELDQRYTVFDTVYQVTSDISLTQARSLLGAFLFRGDEVEKKVAVLSGGEKSRLALAKMIATPANLLIMDEPTNHLDISSQEVLQEAMRQYDGSIIVVSHNRYFVNGFVGRVLEIKEGRGTIYQGNIDEYLEKLRRDRERENAALTDKSSSAAKPPAGTGKKAAATPAAATPQTPGADKGKRGKEERREQAQLRQQKNRQLAPLTKKITQLEKELEEVETRKKTVEQALADPETYQRQDEFTELSREYGSLERRLERLYDQWSTLQAELESMTEAHFS